MYMLYMFTIGFIRINFIFYFQISYKINLNPKI